MFVAKNEVIFIPSPPNAIIPINTRRYNNHVFLVIALQISFILVPHFFLLFEKKEEFSEPILNFIKEYNDLVDDAFDDAGNLKANSRYKTGEYDYSNQKWKSKKIIAT